MNKPSLVYSTSLFENCETSVVYANTYDDYVVAPFIDNNPPNFIVELEVIDKETLDFKVSIVYYIK